MSKHRLLQINVTANLGSTGKIVEAIGVSVINSGWESYIAYGREANTSSSILYRIGSKLNTYSHYLGQRIFDSEGLCSFYATRKLISYIREIKPDIIHLHNIHDHYLNYALLFHYLNNIGLPIVWTFHDCWSFTGHCFHFISKGCNKWKDECCNCPIRDYPPSFFDFSRRNFRKKKATFLQNSNLTIIACSNWLADLVHKSFFKDNPIQVIHNGIDTSIFTPPSKEGKSDREAEEFHILAVSNVWNKEKGLYDIYKLRDLLPNNFVITIVGLSNVQLNSLPSGIIGHSKTHNIYELVKHYQAADVMINLTYADTFPTVNLESLACGTPVITYKTGGSPETIDSKTGIVVNPGDIDAVVNALYRLKESPLSSYDCRCRAEELFDRDSNYKSYLCLYEELLKHE